jgi:hypothetical protein
MKPTESVTLATWMLEHFTFGPNREALSGDLLEEFRHERSASWYRREVASAIGIGVLTKFRNYGPRLIFSFAWSMLYPLWWLCIIKAPLTHTMLVRWATTDWPLSTSLEAVGQIIPAIAFVWLGLFIYLILCTEGLHKPSALRLLASLSISLNVLLITTIGLWSHVSPTGVHLSYVARENFSFHSHLIAISIPLALSLLSAIFSALSHTQRRRHGTASVAS